MDRAKRIIIVEDETAIARGLSFNFEQEGFEPVVFSDGPSVLAFLEEHPDEADLVVLDLMLPGMSGYEICRAIRERDRDVPILVLSARTLAEDKAHAFDCGTDQYMTKPFALPELLSRVRNLLSRTQSSDQDSSRSEKSQELFDLGSVQIDFRAFQIVRGDEEFRLTTMEAQLLRYFLDHEGRVLSRQQILRDVWDQQVDLNTRSIDNFVMRLRKYLEEDPTHPKHLLSVRGTGYRFVASPEA